MASIRKRASNSGVKYQVQVRRSGYKSVIRSFNSLKDAKAFASNVETKIDRSVYQSAKDAETYLFGDLAKRFLNEVLIHKKGYQIERYNIRPVIRYLKDYKLITIRPHIIAAYKKHRLVEVSPGKVKRELGLISRIRTSNHTALYKGAGGVK